MFTRLPSKKEELPRVTAVAHFAPTHEVHLSVMGQPLLFQSNDVRMVDAAADTFAGFPYPEVDETPLVVQVFVQASEKAPVAKPISAKPDYSVKAYSQGHLVMLQSGAGNTAVADLQAGFAYAILTPEFAQDIASVRYSFIEALPQVLLGGRGYVPIHAACVIKNGVTILLCASAGTGKSTLAFTCLRHGYQILAEDVVQVQISQTGVRLWGIPWKFHLMPDVLKFFPDLPVNKPRIPSNGEWKLEIALEELYPGSTVTNAPPGAVVFLHRHGVGPSKLETLSFAEASRMFEPIWSWEIPWLPQYEAQLVKLITERTYSLQMNGSPTEAAVLLDKIVAGFI